MTRLVIFVFLVLFVSIGLIFADNNNLIITTTNSFGFTQFDSIENNFFGYGNFMANNEFSYTSDFTLFASNNASKASDRRVSGFLLNLFLGFGIGSYVQGDTTGGTIGLLGDGIGTALLITCIFKISSATTQYNLDLIHANTSARREQALSDYYSNLENALIFGIISGAVYSASRIFQLIRPFTYANKFSVAVLPNIDNNGQPAMTLSMNYNY